MNLFGRLPAFQLFVILLVPACTPVADPHQGGLFGYSPELYEQRIQEREARLAQTQSQGQAEQARTADLQQDIAASGEELQRLKKEMDTITVELMQTREALKRTEVQSAEAEKKLAELQADLQELSRTSWKTEKQLDQGDIAAKEKEVDALRKQLNALMEEAELLGRL